VARRPFIEHQLELLRSHGATRVIVCIGYRGDLIRAAVGDGLRFGLEVAYSDEGRRLAGTAGAIRQALPLLGDSFLVVYGDAYLRIDYRDVARAFARSPAPGLMTVYRNRGRFDTSNAVYANGRVTAFDKESPPPGAEWIDYGLLAFERTLFEATKHDDLADLQRELASSGHLAGYLARSRFYEIGTPAALAETEDFLRRGAIEPTQREAL
jgi:NDP-sugar pyrophosphorylase family protein